jgi:hypothetical protein
MMLAVGDLSQSVVDHLKHFPLQSSCRRLFSFRLIAGVLFSLATPALAADPATCIRYVAEAVAAAADVRQLDCGFDLSQSRWTTNEAEHTRWCRSVDNDTVEEESQSRQYYVERCGTCRAYADLAKSAANDNILYSCRYSGERWVIDPARHFNWCMTVTWRTGGTFIFPSLHKPWDRVKEEIVNRETGARTQAIAECKQRFVNRSCKSCHAGQSLSLTGRMKSFEIQRDHPVGLKP